MSKDKVNILVTGVGAIIGYGIIKSLRLSDHKVRIIGMDIYDDAYGRFISDEFIHAELASSPQYLNFINDTVKKFEIDLIIPGIEQDLYALHRGKAEIIDKVKTVMNNDLSIDLSSDKLATYNYFKNEAIRMIPTLHDVSFAECVENFSLPFLLKPIRGYASKGIQKIFSAEEFLFYSKKIGYACIYQKLIGSMDSEFTISVFGDGQGSFFDYIILKRQLSQEGATSKAILVEDEDILLYVKEICSLIKPIGPTNIQIRTEKNTPYLLEINPRISSACSIRALMNYNEPEMCIDYFLLGRSPISKPKRKANVVRFISDHITYG